MLILLILFLAKIALTSGMLLRVAFFQKKILLLLAVVVYLVFRCM